MFNIINVIRNINVAKLEFVFSIVNSISLLIITCTRMFAIKMKSIMETHIEEMKHGIGVADNEENKSILSNRVKKEETMIFVFRTITFIIWSITAIQVLLLLKLTNFYMFFIADFVVLFMITKSVDVIRVMQIIVTIEKEVLKRGH